MDWNKDDKSAIEASELGGGLGLESQRADLSNHWGYGNCFASMWQWLKKKWSKR